jgi:hypothetical protein
MAIVIIFQYSYYRQFNIYLDIRPFLGQFRLPMQFYMSKNEVNFISEIAGWSIC